MKAEDHNGSTFSIRLGFADVTGRRVFALKKEQRKSELVNRAVARSLARSLQDADSRTTWLGVGWPSLPPSAMPEKRDICRLSEHSFRTCWGGGSCHGALSLSLSNKTMSDLITFYVGPLGLLHANLRVGAPRR